MTTSHTHLLEPISGDNPGGTDVSFSEAYDEIREARRQDDPSLAQGEWETSLKVAQWPRVKALSEAILSEQSKDIQVAAWYTEAMTRLSGFAGLAAGLQVLDSIVNDFWEFAYPAYDPDDLEERAGKIEWLNKQMPLVIREIPLTPSASGGYSWLKWEESRAVENHGLKDAEARERAVAGGKLAGDVFDRAVQSSGRAYYEALHGDIRRAAEIGAALEQHVDQRFGSDAPSLKDVRQAIAACDELVARLLMQLGGKRVAAAPGTNGGDTSAEVVPEQTAEPAGEAEYDSLDSGTYDSAAEEGMPTATTRRVVIPQPIGAIAQRSDAIDTLRKVAKYFRQNEPHSPVALLAERAATWAEMPLEQWLGAVIKDQSTLEQLRELLDIREISS